MVESDCTMLIAFDKGVPPKDSEIQTKLESSKVQSKIDGMEELLLYMASGEDYRKMLMPVIRFVCTNNDKRLIKLCALFWEMVPKLDEKGELREEMILVCNALRNNLMHPNEYVRGSTLRLLNKIRHYRVLEPLIEPAIRNLTHRHSYVRRNAVMSVYSMVKSFGVDAVPNAVEEIENLLRVESDSSTKRNAFLVLLHVDQDKAVQFVTSMQEDVTSMNDIFQLVLLELIRRVCRTQPALKMRLLRLVLTLSQTSAGTAVLFECASTLLALSSSPNVVKAAVGSYIQLLNESPENNVKLVVLDKLNDVRRRFRSVIEAQLMDILRSLSCPSMELRRKVLEIALGPLVTDKNVKDVMGILKKELTRASGNAGDEANPEYRRLLVRHMHAVVARFPEQAPAIIFILMDLLTESDVSAASDVVMFIRELIAQHPALRATIMSSLSEKCSEMAHSRVIRGCMWLLGEYSDEADLLSSVIENTIRAMEPLPLRLKDKEKDKEKDKKKQKEETAAPKVTTRTVILADGTYGTEEVRENVPEPVEDKEVKTTAWRDMISGGDFLLATVTAVSMTKLLMRKMADGSLGRDHVSPKTRNGSLLLLGCLVQIIRKHPAGGENCDSLPRLLQCLRMLSSGESDPETQKMWAAGDDAARKRLANVIALEAAHLAPGAAIDDGTDESKASTSCDSCLVFRQLIARDRKGGQDMTVEEDEDLQAAKGGGGNQDDGSVFAERIAKSKQLSGSQDPIYVEAFLQVHTLDLLLDLLLVNRTGDTLQNVTVELATHGELRIIDRPPTIVLPPYSQVSVPASIKVSSTETGIIFGYVTYEKTSGSGSGETDNGSIMLADLHIDIIDYMDRAWIGQLAFRTMWSEFEWENKINISTAITEVGKFLESLMSSTNMSIVGRPPPTGEEATQGSQALSMSKRERLTKDEARAQIDETPGLRHLVQTASFVAVNLYSRSIFGEDALANVSIERVGGKITGSVRIRSRTQGIALGLGNSIARGSS